jgi:D-alanyl-D-alanine carboxypeptidase
VSSTVPPNTPELGYAMGFFNASGWWGHNGSIPGFTTYAVYNAESETSVVVFVNSDIYGDGDPPIPPADLIAERLITALG